MASYHVLAARDGYLDYITYSGGVWTRTLAVVTGDYTALAADRWTANYYYGLRAIDATDPNKRGGLDAIYKDGTGWHVESLAASSGLYTALTVDNYSTNQLYESGVCLRPAKPGKEWVRSHQFTFMPWLLSTIDLSDSYYNGIHDSYLHDLGFDPLLLMRTAPQGATQIQPAVDHNFKWHCNLQNGKPGTGFPLDLDVEEANFVINQIYQGSPTADNGWDIRDEPNLGEVPNIARVADWLRYVRPNSLVYMNTAFIYTDNPTAFDLILKHVEPDILMTETYPFQVGGGQDLNGYFNVVATTRNKTLAREVPFFFFAQTFSDSTRRTPSESETRMNIFSLLTAGCKGIGYYKYTGDLLDANLNPTALYNAVKAARSEAAVQGKVLRNLNSTGVWYIPGATTTPPTGLSNWSAAGDDDPHITAISLTRRNTGINENGLVGFFTDDTSQRYFMLTNLNCYQNFSSYDARLTFTITFDSTVNQVYCMDRATGTQVTVNLTNHVLTITNLGGGTGELYSYGNFDTATPTGSISINNGAPYSWYSTVTLNLSATDDIGVTQMKFSDDNLIWGEWEPYSTSKQWALLPGDGTRTVYVKYRDAVGNISAVYSHSIVVDTTPNAPFCDIYYSGGQWNTLQIFTTQNYQYAALTGDGVAQLTYYGTPAEVGGISVSCVDLITYSGGAWNINPLFPSSSYRYQALAADRVVGSYMVGALSGGGIDAIYYDSGQWTRNPLFPQTSAYDFKALAADKASYYYYGAHSNGGIYAIYYAYNQWWCNPIFSTYTYNALATDSQANSHVLAARSGYLDYISYSGTWTRTLGIVTGDYTALTSDPLLADYYYGQRAAGGVDAIYKSGSSWVVSPLTFVGSYTALTSGAGIGYQIFGAGALAPSP